MVQVPKVKTRAIRRQDGVWHLYVTCPFCGQEHHHGGGDGPRPIYGGRAAHCTGDRVGFLEYDLVPEGGRKSTSSREKEQI